MFEESIVEEQQKNQAQIQFEKERGVQTIDTHGTKSSPANDPLSRLRYTNREAVEVAKRTRRGIEFLERAPHFNEFLDLLHQGIL